MNEIMNLGSWHEMNIIKKSSVDRMAGKKEV